MDLTIITTKSTLNLGQPQHAAHVEDVDALLKLPHMKKTLRNPLTRLATCHSPCRYLARALFLPHGRIRNLSRMSSACARRTSAVHYARGTSVHFARCIGTLRSVNIVTQRSINIVSTQRSVNIRTQCSATHSKRDDPKGREAPAAKTPVPTPRTRRATNVPTRHGGRGIKGIPTVCGPLLSRLV